jgi:hypothetical protein
MATPSDMSFLIALSSEKLMRRYLYFTALLIFTLPARAGAQKPLSFEISFAKELSASPVDGHILLILSKDDKSEPRFGVVEGINSQQAFGVDVDSLAPGAAFRVDSTTLGYPLESLRDVPPGDYYVQAVLNIYETFHLGNGKVVKLPPDIVAKVSTGRPNPATS